MTQKTMFKVLKRKAEFAIDIYLKIAFVVFVLWLWVIGYSYIKSAYGAAKNQAISQINTTTFDNLKTLKVDGKEVDGVMFVDTNPNLAEGYNKTESKIKWNDGDRTDEYKPSIDKNYAVITFRTKKGFDIDDKWTADDYSDDVFVWVAANGDDKKMMDVYKRTLTDPDNSVRYNEIPFWVVGDATKDIPELSKGYSIDTAQGVIEYINTKDDSSLKKVYKVVVGWNK